MDTSKPLCTTVSLEREKLPNDQTLAAIQELESGKGTQYNSMKEVWKHKAFLDPRLRPNGLVEDDLSLLCKVHCFELEIKN